MEEIRQEEVETAMHKMKKGTATGADEVRLEMLEMAGEVRRRAQAGANAWRAVEGVMADRRISKRLKGKATSTCVTPACMYGTETFAMTERQQQRMQVCENNWDEK